jgi:hypothetical protein
MTQIQTKTKTQTQTQTQTQTDGQTNKQMQVKFMLEGSNDGTAWVTVGSSSFWTLASIHQFLHDSYNTPLERGQVVAFNMECPWYTMLGYFLTWLLFGLTFLLMFLVSMLNVSRFGKHAMTLGFTSVSAVSFCAGAGFLSNGLVGDATYFFWAAVGFACVGIGMAVFEKYFDIVCFFSTTLVMVAQVRDVLRFLRGSNR